MSHAFQPIWAVCCYFNPAGWRSRYRNYRTFRRNLSIPLVTVELVYGSHGELGDDDAETLIRLPGRDVMWQKERLLNVALSSVPTSCQYIAWLDCDIVFHNPDWHEKAVKALQQFDLIQPFSRVTTSLPHVPPPSPPRECHSSAYLINSGEAPEDVLFRFSQRSATGLAWASRRAVIERHGLYDANIIGGGDRAIACAAWGVASDYARVTFNQRQSDYYQPWANAFFSSVTRNVGCLTGDLTSLWHGSVEHRRYRQRFSVLKTHDFDPLRDLRVDDNGAWAWNSGKPELHASVAEYLSSRREDSPCPFSQPHCRQSNPNQQDESSD